MKFIKWVGLILLVLLAFFLITPIFLPSNFHIERSVEIDKPVNMVFEAAINMNIRSEWDPWIEMEPEAEINVFMQPGIIGSGYSWKGEKIGEGKITIQEFVPNEIIKSKIEFYSPQNMESDIIWSFIEGKNTKITWAFKGELSYPVERWFGLFMEKSLGSQFEKGLDNFKKVVTKLPDNKGRTENIELTQFEGLIGIGMRKECSKENITGEMISMYSVLMRYLKENNMKTTGSPFAIYHKTEKENIIDLECGLPVDRKIKENGKIKTVKINPVKAIMASHFGHYNTIESTRNAIDKYLKEKGLEISGSPWEIYLTDPIKEPDQDKWETKVYFPIK